MPETTIEVVNGLRIVTTQDAIDALMSEGLDIIRLAPDEALLLGDLTEIDIDDRWAIVEADTSFSAIYTDVTTASVFLARTSELSVGPDASVIRGLAAGLALTVRRTGDHCSLLVPTPFAHELAERFHEALE